MPDFDFFNDPCLQLLVELLQRGFRCGPLLDFPLRRLIELRIVDGDRCLPSYARHQTFVALAEAARIGMPEEQAANDLVAARDDRHREITLYGKMTLRQALFGAFLP